MEVSGSTSAFRIATDIIPGQISGNKRGKMESMLRPLRRIIGLDLKRISADNPLDGIDSIDPLIAGYETGQLAASVISRALSDSTFLFDVDHVDVALPRSIKRNPWYRRLRRLLLRSLTCTCIPTHPNIQSPLT